MLPAIACALAPGVARAEGDQALSAELGWATFSTPGKKVGTMEPPAVTPDVGGTLGVVYERSLSSDFSLRGELAGAMFSGGNSTKQSSLSYAGIGDVGGVFRFDVLKYVPYAFGGVGAIVSSGGPIDKGSELVLAIGGGCDVLASRSRSYGIEGRLASFGGNITIFTLSVRGTIRWGYF
ncbi:MAG: hypothetical protein ACM31C_10210 [Acidobacteriota bacterium]